MASLSNCLGSKCKNPERGVRWEEGRKGGEDEKEKKLVDKKKFEKKVSEIFKLESDIIENCREHA